MSLGSTLLTIFEMFLVCFTVWAVFHENLFIAFEEKLFAKIRRSRFKVLRGNKVSKSYYPKKHGA